MAVRWGVSLPGPFCISFGRAMVERDPRRSFVANVVVAGFGFIVLMALFVSRLFLVLAVIASNLIAAAISERQAVVPTGAPASHVARYSDRR
jgi:ABC-type uncharacterized transport system permease subunit